MNKPQSENLITAAVQEYIDICSHCGTKAHLKMIFQDTHLDDDRNLIYYITFRCVPCKKLILKTAKFTQNPYDKNENLEFSGWSGKFPDQNVAFVNKFNGIVPDDALEDFKEGVVDLQNGCIKSAVSMFRRSLQDSLINLGADKKQDLIDQIKSVPKLTEDIKDWSHNIRILGNWGAHPQDDNLKDIDQEKAEEVQSFLEEFFNYVYIMPNRVSKARKSTSPIKDEELNSKESDTGK